MKYFVVFYIPFLVSFVSCGDSFLEAKPDKALVVPKTLDDYQAILDDVNQQINQSPGLMEASIDDYIVKEDGLNMISEDVRNAYLWNREGLVALESHYDWNRLYAQVLRANLVLEGLQEIRPEQEENRYREIKGAAYFFRAWHFFNLLQVYSAPYDSQTANTDLGIVLKLSADVNEHIGRSTVEMCYAQILDDLENAILLLPSTSFVASRPNLVAAYGLLARVYLSRFDYVHTERYARSALDIKNNLLDFNDVGTIFPDPLLVGNDEVLFHSIPILQASSLIRNAIIDPNLVNLYDEGDLRKTKFLKFDDAGNAQINRTYFGSTVAPYSGLTTSEMYLVLAESLTQLDRLNEAMDVLNALRKTRFDKTVSYVNLEAQNKEDALVHIYKERRQELVFRGLRWYDLRRLNKDPQFSTTLVRIYNGTTYTLKPDSEFYCFPIPRNELLYNLDLSLDN